MGAGLAVDIVPIEKQLRNYEAMCNEVEDHNSKRNQCKKYLELKLKELKSTLHE